MIWWQALLLASAPAALTAAALLLQSALTRRHESARQWADARLSAHAELWWTFHSILGAVDDQAEAARAVDPETPLTTAGRLVEIRDGFSAAFDDHATAARGELSLRT